MEESSTGQSLRREFSTMPNMNKPLYFLGLTGTQLAVVFLITLLGYMIFQLWGFILVAALYYPCKRNYEEWRKGCPDYYIAYKTWKRTPRHLGDESNLLKHL